MSATPGDRHDGTAPPGSAGPEPCSGPQTVGVHTSGTKAYPAVARATWPKQGKSRCMPATISRSRRHVHDALPGFDGGGAIHVEAHSRLRPGELHARHVHDIGPGSAATRRPRRPSQPECPGVCPGSGTMECRGALRRRSAAGSGRRKPRSCRGRVHEPSVLIVRGMQPGSHRQPQIPVIIRRAPPVPRWETPRRPSY